MRRHFTLDPDVVFLNHGAFGACPAKVQEAQSRFRTELEREPVRFFGTFLGSTLDQARSEVAAFVGARPEDLAFVQNTTTGVSAVLRSLHFQPGDALLTTNHTYGACRNALDFTAKRAGAEVIVANLPIPSDGPEDVVRRITEAAVSAGPRVKLALIDHVTSPTGLVLPIVDIVRALRERGVDTLVDGAHGPGMVELDVNAIGAAYYVGNFHKWVCSPKGAAMLWVREDRQTGVHPGVISHGYTSTRNRSRFLEEFDWTGSDDPSAWLCVPEAIRFIGSLVPGGWPEVRRRNRALVLEARALLSATLGAPLLAPESMIGSLASLPLPDAAPGASRNPYEEPLHCALLEKYGIEVPAFIWPAPPSRLVRVAAHLYNTLEEFQKLASALRTELRL
ncbi:MAG TPA: aminotransferase class V-fold PLP-dependent enzyme [Polyangiaceae bacterium]